MDSLVSSQKIRLWFPKRFLTRTRTLSGWSEVSCYGVPHPKSCFINVILKTLLQNFIIFFEQCILRYFHFCCSILHL